jgi:hypothetical protein
MANRLTDLTYKEMESPRYQRAVRFTNTILSIMRDFVPQGRDVRNIMYDHLLELGYQTNAELINVPPEWDALNKLQIERAMLEKFNKPLNITIEDTPLA